MTGQFSITLQRVQTKVTVVDKVGRWIDLDTVIELAVAKQGLMLLAFEAEGIRGAITMHAFCYGILAQQAVIAEIQRLYTKECEAWKC